MKFAINIKFKLRYEEYALLIKDARIIIIAFISLINAIMIYDFQLNL